MFAPASRQFIAALMLIALSFNFGVHFVHAMVSARVLAASEAGSVTAGESALLAALTQICTRAGLAGTKSDGGSDQPLDPCFVCLHFVTAGLLVLAALLLGPANRAGLRLRPPPRRLPEPCAIHVGRARAPPLVPLAVC